MEKEREKLSKLLLSKKAFKEKKALDLARKQLSAKEYRRLLLQRRVSKVSENLGKDIRASLKKQPLSVGAMQRVFTERFKPRARGYVMGSPSSNILAAGNNAFTSNQIQEERRRKLSNLSMSSMWIIFMGGQK